MHTKTVQVGAPLRISVRLERFDEPVVLTAELMRHHWRDGLSSIHSDSKTYRNTGSREYLVVIPSAPNPQQ